MLNKILYITSFLFFVSCSSSNPEAQIQYLDGYWEIEKVILSDGTEKKYNFNQSIDFFEVKDSVGIRKKLQPQLNGNFISTKDNETFTLKIEQDSLRIYYKTPQSSWKETIISAKENRMTITNNTGNVYFYKRYQKLSL
ncbi:lipocalin family protein [Aquimarina sp. MMG016]|uniref:lipocalin family protein n=1 Tax=Aquimarina sp. MMG016 TaxID=2822690 RepID=UPI001B3A2806|nr:lipocalin family protein [Aquimarina sp. MMG016]MBQ4822684.1 lipocalin family protein [Aquimarina sp. MMG016]